MFRHYFVATALILGSLVLPQSVMANVPAWESWRPVYTPQPYAQPYQQQRREYAPPRQGNPVYRQTAYGSALPFDDSLECGYAQALQLPDQCIRKNAYTREGLQTQASYLRRVPAAQKVGVGWGNISNAALLETVHELLNWHDGIAPGTLQQRFSLREISSWRGDAKAEYTGYFTPLLEVRTHPNSEYRIPIYRKPNGQLAQLSHADIARRALGGKGLEVAWTNDLANLFFAQVQGSGIARFPDGKEMMLEYAGDNGRTFSSIAAYMKQRGIKLRNYGNEAIRDWLRANPQRAGEIITSNPRYVFFKLTAGLPTTASGTRVIPGHTVAVDRNYIPLGAVLLAEVPRLDANGREIGRDWRLLFAQDQGGDIKGAGRLDLYTGFGRQAENIAHGITGFRKAYMLVRKPAYGGNTNMAER